MRLGLILLLCSGCHLLLDPDEYVSEGVDAATDAGDDAGDTDAGEEDAGGEDAGRDARADTGCGMLPMTMMGPPCCFVNADCPTGTGMMGGELVCHAGMCGGEPGVCFPRTMSRTTGSTCFLDSDCDSGTCLGGPNCGCEVPCSTGTPAPGVCM